MRRRAPEKLMVRRAIAFSVAFVLPVYYALRGGSYDLIARHEEGLIIWAIIAICLALGVIPRSRLHRLTLIPLAGFAALTALVLLSLAWTESDEQTLEELARVIHYSGLVLLAIWALNRHTARGAAAGLTLGALFVSALAVASRLQPESFPVDDVAQLIDTDRLSYPLDYWNATAAWGAMAIAAALAWSAHARRPGVRALFLAGVPFAGLAVYLSYSRAGVIGSVVAVLAVLALSRNRWTALTHIVAAGAGTAFVIAIARSHPEIAEATGGSGGGETLAALLASALTLAGVAVATGLLHVDSVRMPRQPARATAALGGVAAVIALAATWQGPLGDAWDEFKNQRTVSIGASADPAARLTQAGGTRDDVWNSALDAFEAEPLGGIGPGAFQYWWSRTQPTPEFLRDAHMLYFEQLAELGLPGLLATLVALGGLGVAGLWARGRLERSVDFGANAAMLAMFAVFLVHAGVDWMWELTAVSLLGLGAGAIAASFASGRRGSSTTLPLRIAAIALAAIAVIAQIPGLVSTARTRESDVALAAGDQVAARRLAQEAVDAQPWAATPYIQRAAVAERQRRYDDARLDLLEAVGNEPTNWRPWILLAQVELKRGDLKSARKAFEEAKDLHPVSRFYSTFPAFRYQIIGGPPPPAVAPPSGPALSPLPGQAAPLPEP